MSYSYTWIPQTHRPSGKSNVSVRTWNGKPVPSASISVVDGKINLVVPEKNLYKLTVHTGTISETIRIVIPPEKPQPPLSERVEYLESIIQFGDGTTSLNLIPDPNNEGFFIVR